MENSSGDAVLHYGTGMIRRKQNYLTSVFMPASITGNVFKSESIEHTWAWWLRGRQ